MQMQNTQHPNSAQTKSTHNYVAAFATPEPRARRKIAREVAAAYDALLRAAGFTPAERRGAWAIELCLYELDGQAPDTPRPIALGLIGAHLTSKSDEPKAKTDRARETTGHLFNHAIPRASYQIQTRYKTEEESGRPHEFASHAFAVAELVAEQWAEEKKSILAARDSKGKAVKIAEALERLATEALGLLPRCEAEIVAPTGEVYARVSAPEAKAYCVKNPEFTLREYSYTPPADDDEQPHPIYSEDLARIGERIERAIEKELDQVLNRGGLDVALLFASEEESRVAKLFASWRKVAGTRPARRKEQHEELIHGGENRGGHPADVVENSQDTPPEHGGVPSNNPVENNDLQKTVFETSENQQAGSINFDTSLEAALFYAQDGWHVLPICNFNPERGRCTSDRHEETCRGKRPLVAGKGDHKPGDGYTAASRDLGQIRDWFTRHFPAAGVGIRLDGHIVVDCDVKDGARGLESYEFLRDTFELPQTLTALTHSGGRHYVFKLPEGLPDKWLMSWTRPLDKIELGGIDLKVGNCGLMYAEPTRGSKGVYRWIDPTVEPAVLPIAVCNFFREIRYKDDETKAKKKAYASSQTRRQPVTDQSECFRDVSAGERHKRLLAIGTAARAQDKRSAAEIADIMRYHAARFSEPLNDDAWIVRTARSIESRY